MSSYFRDATLDVVTTPRIDEKMGVKMINKKEIREIIISTLIQLKEEMEDALETEINDDTVLIGQEGILDSLGLVNLIVTTEEKIEEEFQKVITLANEEAMSQKNSPFRTVRTFIEYISLLLDKNENK